MHQVISVSSYGTDINNGLVTANLSGYIGGFSSDTDNLTVVAKFLNGSAASLGQMEIGSGSPAERNNLTQLLFEAASAKLPVGTVAIDLVLTAFHLTGGSYTDGYADNLSLTLTTGALQGTPTTVSINVMGLNDAPVLNAGATPVLASVNEDAGAPLGAVGTLVSALVDLNPPSGGLDNVTDA